VRSKERQPAVRQQQQPAATHYYYYYYWLVVPSFPAAAATTKNPAAAADIWTKTDQLLLQAVFTPEKELSQWAVL
jgi:hypothetical protein